MSFEHLWVPFLGALLFFLLSPLLVKFGLLTSTPA
jgi:hypothetical protein